MSKISKILESALQIQNKNKDKNISQMQTAGRKQGSIVDNLIILNSIIENQKQKNVKHIYYLQMSKNVLINCR